MSSLARSFSALTTAHPAGGPWVELVWVASAGQADPACQRERLTGCGSGSGSPAACGSGSPAAGAGAAERLRLRERLREG